MKKTVLILVMALLAVAAACRAKKSVSVDPGEKGSDKKMYENAVKYMTKDPEKARLLFKEVGQLYPDSIYASKSKLGIGDAYFKERDSASLVMAASEYQEYVNLYP
jgi:outer membrane protein assembly factor BamD